MNIYRITVRFQGLTAASMTTVLWDVAPCNLVVYRRFRGAYYLYQLGR
jgi:hypothetical protein